MIELLAGAMVAAAALAYVLEPLGRHTGGLVSQDHPAGDEAASLNQAGTALVGRFRDRLVAVCPRCQRPAEPGSAFCVRCGKVLIE